MQFTFAFFTAALATLVAASPAPRDTCSTGPIQCCNSVTTANDPSAAKALGLVGIVVQDLNIPIGLTCSPIDLVGVGNGGCKAQAVCCENNSKGGLVSVGCLPVQL